LPDSVWVVAGTATEIGKTWVAAALAETLKERGFDVACRKPVQSFDPDDGATDADVLAAATGADPVTVCPTHRRYELAIAPPMAADTLGRDRIELEHLFAELALPETGIAFIEGVGGPRSPLAHDGDTVLLAWLLRAPVILVASSGLGVINDVRLARDAFAPLPVATFMNRFDEADSLHRANRDWLRDHVGATVCTTIDELAELITHVPDGSGSNDNKDEQVEAG
jgi:dethiobiotin synthetase